MIVVICARYGVCYLFLTESSVESAQVNIFTEEVVFRLNISCKIIFVLSVKTF